MVYNRGEENNKNKKKKISLNSLNTGEKGFIVFTPEHSLLPVMGIRKGKEIKLVERQWSQGPLIVKIDERSIALERELAERILVLPGE